MPGGDEQKPVGDLDDVIRKGQHGAVAIRQLYGQTPGGYLLDQPNRRREDAAQAYQEGGRGQRNPGLDGDPQELGNQAEVCSGYAGSLLGDRRYAFAPDLGETRPRRRIVGDVVGDVVDLTGRQELLEP